MFIRRLSLPFLAVVAAMGLSGCSLLQAPLGMASGVLNNPVGAATGIINMGVGTARTTGSAALRTAIQTAKELAPYAAAAATGGF